jgi:N-methylhydantoinase B
MKLDPTDRTFYHHLFVSIAEEMGGCLMRTAYSPNIKERKDFSCAVFSAAGELIAQAAHIPVHLGAMPMSVAAVREAFPDMGPGDVYIVNDPFRGGTHLPDLTLVSPVCIDDQVIAYLATRAHHADVGGISPGSLPLSTSIYQEGFRIPPMRLTDEVTTLLCANSRTPEERRGDLRAQISAHGVGEQRMYDCVHKYTWSVMQQSMGEILTYGEQLMKGLIQRIPNGRYVFEDVLDNDGQTDDPIRIKVDISIKGYRAKVDFTGTDPQVRGSLNAVEAITQSAVYYCFLCLVATPSHLHRFPVHNPPLNSGSFRPIEVVAPSGSVVNACEPAAVAGGNVETSQRIVDVVFGALAKALPGVIPAASQGTMNNLTIGGLDPRNDRPFAYYETIAGGMGARPGADGLSGVQVHMTNTLNTPVEALEYAYPFRVDRYAFRTGSGGKGTHAGGDGIIRSLTLLADAEVTLLTDRRTHAPYGVNGGEPGRCGRNTINGKDVGGKVARRLKAGDRLSIETPGGGGYGA